jgi:hypothetical protein
MTYGGDGFSFYMLFLRSAVHTPRLPIQTASNRCRCHQNRSRALSPLGDSCYMGLE